MAAEQEVREHARVSLCRQAQQAGSLSDDELEYTSASSPGHTGRGGPGLAGAGAGADAREADERPSQAVLDAARAAASGQPCARPLVHHARARRAAAVLVADGPCLRTYAYILLELIS